MKILEPIQMIGEYAKTAEEKIIPILDLKALGKKHFHLIVKPPSSDKISYYVGEIDDIPQCNTYNLANVLSFDKEGLEFPVMLGCCSS